MSVSPFDSLSFCFMHFGASLSNAYVNYDVFLRDWPFHQYVMSFFVSCFFFFFFGLNIYFKHVTLQLSGLMVSDEKQTFNLFEYPLHVTGCILLLLSTFSLSLAFDSLTMTGIDVALFEFIFRICCAPWMGRLMGAFFPQVLHQIWEVFRH